MKEETIAFNVEEIGPKISEILRGTGSHQIQQVEGIRLSEISRGTSTHPKCQGLVEINRRPSRHAKMMCQTKNHLNVGRPLVL